MREQHDVVVVGGGQAGLAVSTVLQRTGRCNCRATRTGAMIPTVSHTTVKSFV
jgi:succinate dehydrogenase/fumarate reductase flavoprotein subunit